MSTSAVLVVVFAAVALGLASFSLWISWGARRDARHAVHAVRTLTARGPKRAPVDERQVNLGAPRATGERRRHDEGVMARHRAPDDERARRRDQDDPQWSTNPEATNPVPAARPDNDLATVEQPAPSSTYRRPPPPLPPPGAISREA